MLGAKPKCSNGRPKRSQRTQLPGARRGPTRLCSPTHSCAGYPASGRAFGGVTSHLYHQRPRRRVVLGRQPARTDRYGFHRCKPLGYSSVGGGPSACRVDLSGRLDELCSSGLERVVLGQQQHGSVWRNLRIRVSLSTSPHDARLSTENTCASHFACEHRGQETPVQRRQLFGSWNKGNLALIAMEAVCESSYF